MGFAPVLAFILGLLSVVAAVIFFRAGRRELTLQQQLLETGIDGEAVITKRVTIIARPISYAVAFQFDATGPDGRNVSYTQEQKVSTGLYRTLVEGTKVPIRYLSTNPGHTARLAGAFANQVDMNTYFTFGGSCLVIALLVLSFAAYSVFQLAQAPRMAAAEFAAVRTAVEPHFVEWKQVSDQVVHELSPVSVGLDTQVFGGVYYGYCADGTFYTYVTKGYQVGTTGGILVQYSDAYGYTSISEDACSPRSWVVTKQNDLDDGWFSAQAMITNEIPTPSS